MRIKGSIKKYIEEQPRVIQRVFEEVPEQMETIFKFFPKKAVPHKIFLVGSGSSQNVLVGISFLMRALLKKEVIVRSPMEFITSPLTCEGKNGFGIFLSQSGRSTTTIRALNYAEHHDITTLAITAEKDSPMALRATRKIIMPLGNEIVGPKTKGYTGSIATLFTVLIKLANLWNLTTQNSNLSSKEARSFCQEMSILMPKWRALGNKMAKVLWASKFIMILGQQRHLGTALEASLKINEICGIPSMALNTEEAFHGRFHSLDQKSVAFFIAQSEDEIALADLAIKSLSKRGIPCHLLALKSQLINRYSKFNSKGEILPSLIAIEMPQISYRWRLFQELDLLIFIIPFQYFAYRVAILRGMRPENMRYPNLSEELGIKE